MASFFVMVDAKTPSQMLGRQLCEETNKFRAEQGLDPFQISYTMEEVAQAHLDNLIEANHNVFNQECNMHSWYEGNYFGAQVPYCCYPRDRCMGGKGQELSANWNTPYTGRTGENAYASLGSGFGFGGGSVSGAIESWKNSPGHRALMVGSGKACGGVLNTTFTGTSAQTIGLLWVGTTEDLIPLDYEGRPEDYGSSVPTPTTPRPTVRPTVSPSANPTPLPSPLPTPFPTPLSTPSPPEPTTTTTMTITVVPTTQPTSSTMTSTTDVMTVESSTSSTTDIVTSPMVNPTTKPSTNPTDSPTPNPTDSPTDSPTPELDDSETDTALQSVSFFFLGAFSIGTAIAICLCVMMYKRWYWDTNSLARAEKGELRQRPVNADGTNMREFNFSSSNGEGVRSGTISEADSPDPLLDWEAIRREVRREARRQAKHQAIHQIHRRERRARRARGDGERNRREARATRIETRDPNDLELSRSSRRMSIRFGDDVADYVKETVQRAEAEARAKKFEPVNGGGRPQMIVHDITPSPDVTELSGENSVDVEDDRGMRY